MEEKKVCYWKTSINLLISILATAATIYVGIQGILFFIPFVIGWIIAVIASPVVKWLEKRLKIVRKLGSAMIIIAVLALIVAGGYFLITRLWSLVMDFMESFPEYYKSIEIEFGQAAMTLSGVLEDLPVGVYNSLMTIVNDLDTYMGQIISALSEPTVSAASKFAKGIPSFLISAIVMIVAAYFFIADRDSVILWAKKVTPKVIQQKMELVTYNFKYALGGYFKAQFKIMGIVVIILAVCLSLLGVKYAPLVSILIGMLDFLPFFGTGTAMIPWAIFKVLVGDYKMAIFLVIIYIATQAVRQLIQPKLVADSIGMNPLVTLLLLYSGYKLGGVVGMIVVIPVGFIVMNLIKAGAFDYIIDDVEILIKGILSLRE